jgi:CubicO group peptidase (beta-lactamase class C family)
MVSAFVYLSAQFMATQTASAPKAVPADVQQHIEKVASCLRSAVVVKDDPRPCTTLNERMTQLHVPGVSVAVIHNGSIEWERGFGVKQVGGESVSANTLFQAGSISKPLAAMAALHQVQDKKLSLDADLNSELVTWKIPESPAANGKAVTLRELLTHTAGFTVHGFPGYAANDPVPTLIQVLDGQKPANTPPIRLESEPGSKWNYSGGGYTVLQQTLLDATKEPFSKLMHDTVLVPIGMTHSTYQQPLPSGLQPEAARPHDDSGMLYLAGLTPILKWRPQACGPLHRIWLVIVSRQNALCREKPITFYHRISPSKWLLPVRKNMVSDCRSVRPPIHISPMAA